MKQNTSLHKIVHCNDIYQIEKWSLQLAELMAITWSDTEGNYHNINSKAKEREYWEECIAKEWQNGTMISAILVENDVQIIAHTAIKKSDRYGDGWEIGMSMALPGALKGATTKLCQFLIDQDIGIERSSGIYGRCLVTTTSIQYIASEILNMRFAGIDFLGSDREWWEAFVLFDTIKEPDFVPVKGILGNPLGKKIFFEKEKHSRKLKIFSSRLTTEKGGEMPPEKACILPKYIEIVRSICSVNSY